MNERITHPPSPGTAAAAHSFPRGGETDAMKEVLLRAVGVGVALADAASGVIRFVNPKFAEWFEGACVGAIISEVMPGLDRAKVDAAHAQDRAYELEVTQKVRRRTRSLAVSVAAGEIDGAPILVIECQNISRVRELESMIDSYSALVERRNRDLEREKERVEKLLLNIMPPQVYEEYKTFGVVTPQLYPDVAVLMLDFVGFVAISESVEPTTLVGELNDLYSAFDRIGEQFGCERIKTIGDAYLAVAGMPVPVGDSAEAAAQAAVRFVRYLDRRNQGRSLQWRCRIGVASGSVVGSVVGLQKYVYDVFGPAVNMAARLQDQAEPMEIIVDEKSAAMLKDAFTLEPRGSVELQGFGPRTLFRLVDAL